MQQQQEQVNPLEIALKVLHKFREGGIGSIEHEPFDYPEPQSQLIQPESTKIPKKPNFLHAKYSCIRHARQVRTKLWKLKSCTIHPIQGEEPLFKKLGTSLSDDDQKFLNIFSRPTLRTSMKTVRKVRVGSTIHQDTSLYKRISPSWKLVDSLEFNISKSYLASGQFPQAIIKPKLKECWVKTDINAYEADFEAARSSLMYFISKFKRCLDCNLWFSYNRTIPKILMSTNQLVSFKKHLFLAYRSQDLPSKIILTSAEALEQACLRSNPNIFLPGHQPAKLPILPNLQKLHLIGDISPTILNDTDLSLYSKLESLFVQFKYNIPGSFSNLASLPSLKILSLSFNNDQVPKGLFAAIPEIQSLEQLNVHLSIYTQFDAEDLRNALPKIKNLKTLGFECGIQNIHEIFGNDLTLMITQLSVILHSDAKLFKDAVKGFAKTLERHKQIKSLYLSFTQCHASVNDVIFKAVAKFESLIAFKVNLGMMTEVENNVLKELKAALSKNPTLKAFCLKMNSIPIPTRDLSGLTDALAKLKNLQKISLDLLFQKPTEASFQKFLDFVKSKRRIKSLRLVIRGCSDGQEKELTKFLNTESFLW